MQQFFRSLYSNCQIIYIRVICGFYYIFGENILAQDCHFCFAIFVLSFSVQFHLLVNLSVISIPQSHFRLQPWETCEMGMGPSVKHVFRIFEWFLPVLPNHSGIVCFFKVPGQLVLWIVIKVDKLKDTRGTSRLTNSRQILLTHFSKSIRLQMHKLNSICGLNTYNIGTW